jgi:hypothetical protein
VRLRPLLVHDDRVGRLLALMDLSKLSDDEVQKIIFNPAYTGLGDFPAVVDQKIWITAASRAVKQVGARKYLQKMLQSLRAAFPRGGEASFALGSKDKVGEGPLAGLKPLKRAEENTPYDVRERLIWDVARAIAPVLLKHLASVEWRVAPDSPAWIHQAAAAAAKRSKLDVDYIRDQIGSVLSVSTIDGLDIMQVFDEAIMGDMMNAISAEARRAGHKERQSDSAAEACLEEGNIEWAAQPDDSRGDQWTMKDGDRPDR